MNGPAAARERGLVLVALVLLANLLVWAVAIVTYASTSSALTLALVVYTLGLRHGLDADHIAAIDNVTRKFVAEKRPSVALGLFFALGHSSLVILATVLVAGLAMRWSRWGPLGEYGGWCGALGSAALLLLLAAMNLPVLRASWRALHGNGTGETTAPRGLLAAVLAPLLRSIRHSWQMLFVGALFGLGFDTATEVAMFSIAAAQAAAMHSLSATLILPLLFAGGMGLVDTLDGVLMTGAYRWATEDPARKLRYNLVVTATSTLLALGAAVAQLVHLLGALRPSLALSAPWLPSSEVVGGSIALGLLLVWAFSARASRVARRATRPPHALARANGISLAVVGGGAQNRSAGS